MLCLNLLADALKINAIAEGVETQELVELLKKLGCTECQGFYFSKPLSLDDYQKILHQEEPRKIQQ